MACHGRLRAPDAKEASALVCACRSNYCEIAGASCVHLVDLAVAFECVGLGGAEYTT